VKHKRNLPDDFQVKKNTVKKRIQRNRTSVQAHEFGGGISTRPLLAKVESRIVERILSMMMSQQESRKSLLVTKKEIVHLVNSIIEGTEWTKNSLHSRNDNKIKHS
jgi:hypothetical protein